MSSSEALQQIRQTVTEYGEKHNVVFGEHSLDHSVTIPHLSIVEVGTCSAINIKHSVRSNLGYTAFSVAMRYSVKRSFYLGGEVEQAATLRIDTADHELLDSHMQDRKDRASREEFIHGDPIPFPGHLNRSTTLPKASAKAERMPHIYTGTKQLWMASLALKQITRKYPPAGLLAVGNYGAVSGDWFEHFATWLDKNKTAE